MLLIAKHVEISLSFANTCKALFVASGRPVGLVLLGSNFANYQTVQSFLGLVEIFAKIIDKKLRGRSICGWLSLEAYNSFNFWDIMLNFDFCNNKPLNKLEICKMPGIYFYMKKAWDVLCQKFLLHDISKFEGVTGL